MTKHKTLVLYRNWFSRLAALVRIAREIKKIVRKIKPSSLTARWNRQVSFYYLDFGYRHWNRTSITLMSDLI